MLHLPTVTLFCADCVDAARAVNIMEKCTRRCEFGAVKLLTSLPTAYPHAVPIKPLRTHLDYSVFMLTEAHAYIETEHMLVVQHDGFVINPDVWNPEWLRYGYMGPLFIHRHTIGPASVGSGGFSLRAQKLMASIAAKLPPWNWTCDSAQYQTKLGLYEDGMISMIYRPELEKQGFVYAPPEVACIFAQGGNCDPGFYVRRPFGFHGLWPNINQETGEVEPWPWP